MPSRRLILTIAHSSCAFLTADVAPIASRVDTFQYSFAYFCPPAGTSPMPYWASAPYGSCTASSEFELMSVEQTDAQQISTMIGYKAQNPGLKVLASVGGWNFPSSYFSKMVASKASRAKFIQKSRQVDKAKFLASDFDKEMLLGKTFATGADGARR